MKYIKISLLFAGVFLWNFPSTAPKNTLNAQSYSVCLMGSRLAPTNPASHYACLRTSDGNLCARFQMANAGNPLSFYTLSNTDCQSIGFTGNAIQGSFGFLYTCSVAGNGREPVCPTALVDVMRQRIGF